MPASIPKPTIPRTAGDHTIFLGDPVQETLFSMVVALLGELAVMRDRLDAHVRLLQAAGLPLAPDQVDGYEVDETVAKQRAVTRERMIRHVFRAIHEKLPPAELRAQTESYAGILAAVQAAAPVTTRAAPPQNARS